MSGSLEPHCGHSVSRWGAVADVSASEVDASGVMWTGSSAGWIGDVVVSTSLARRAADRVTIPHWGCRDGERIPEHRIRDAQRPRMRLKPGSDSSLGAPQARRKPPPDADPKGALEEPGNNLLSRISTIIGGACLTTVFGMGTGVARNL